MNEKTIDNDTAPVEAVGEPTPVASDASLFVTAELVSSQRYRWDPPRLCAVCDAPVESGDGIQVCIRSDEGVMPVLVRSIYMHDGCAARAMTAIEEKYAQARRALRDETAAAERMFGCGHA